MREPERSQQPAEGVDIPADLQAEIRAFAVRLPDMTYHEILGIERDADGDAVRRGFFERSKRFHPDRYFNRRLAGFEPLLHEIYKRVVAANEVLRDEKLRAEYEQALREPARPRLFSSNRVMRLPGAPRAERGEGRSLREREGLRSPHTVLRDLELRLEHSRGKGREHFDAAQQERERGDWVRAASLIRLALAFDPREPEYHEALAEVVPRANAEQAETVRARGEMLLNRGEADEALEYLEEAFRLVPTDAPLGHRIASMLLERGELKRGAEIARQAVELEERCAEYRKLLGLILVEQGLRSEGRKELTRAWELDPMDKEVKQALSVL